MWIRVPLSSDGYHIQMIDRQCFPIESIILKFIDIPVEPIEYYLSETINDGIGPIPWDVPQPDFHVIDVNPCHLSAP